MKKSSSPPLVFDSSVPPVSPPGLTHSSFSTQALTPDHSECDTTTFFTESPPFHGFGPETVFPDNIDIKTVGEEGEEQVVSIVRKKRTGRPPGRRVGERERETDAVDPGK